MPPLLQPLPPVRLKENRSPPPPGCPSPASSLPGHWERVGKVLTLCVHIYMCLSYISYTATPVTFPSQSSPTPSSSRVSYHSPHLPVLTWGLPAHRDLWKLSPLVICSCRLLLCFLLLPALYQGIGNEQGKFCPPAFVSLVVSLVTCPSQYSPTLSRVSSCHSPHLPGRIWELPAHRDQ